MDQRLRRMVGHGAIVTVFGLVAGFGLLMSLIGGFEVLPGTLVPFDLPGDPRAWARTHAGGLMNGLLVLTGAVVLHAMRLNERTTARLYWMLVGTGYANTVFYWGGLLSPSRALTFGDNRLGDSNLAGIVGLVPAFVFAFVTTAAMLILAREAFRRPPAGS
jgi:hypothetical protein